MFASASEDATIKLWHIPEDWEPTDAKGIAKSGKNLTESIVDLAGHKKRVTLLNFHPTAANVLGSTSADCTVKIWDVEKAEEISTFSDCNDLMQDIIWDFRGDVLATSCKDKMIRYLDPRSGKVENMIQTPHDGLKTVKMAYLGESGKFLTTGASKSNAREVKIWDLKNLASPLSTEPIDTASGALLPLFDSDSNLLFLCGKGDGIIRPYEFENSEPFLHKMNDGFRSTVPAKGLCLVPKRGLNVMECETARILKLTNNEGVHPLSWTVPRKADGFQDDLFPDCAASSPAHSAEEWVAGSSKAPVTMSLNPSAARASNGAKKITLKSASSIAAELDKAQDRIKYLETLLKDNGIHY
jgi:coronin-1B/1C/6